MSEDREFEFSFFDDDTKIFDENAPKRKKQIKEVTKETKPEPVKKKKPVTIINLKV